MSHHADREPRARHHAGKAPRKPRPFPRAVAEDVTEIVPTGERSVLDTDAHHLPTFNQGIKLIADRVARTGRGSYTGKPEIGPTARAYVKAQRVRRLRRLAHTLSFAICVATFGSVAAWLTVQAWVHADDPTPVQVRSVSPVLIIAAAAMLLLVISMFLTWWDGRPR